MSVNRNRQENVCEKCGRRAQRFGLCEVHLAEAAAEAGLTTACYVKLRAAQERELAEAVNA